MLFVKVAGVGTGGVESVWGGRGDVGGEVGPEVG